jgi:preprotein translocase SecE subunit
MNRLTKPFRVVAGFLAGISAELKLMKWVKGRELAKYTFVVVAYAVSLTLFIYIVDALLVVARAGLLGSGGI